MFTELIFMKQIKHDRDILPKFTFKYIFIKIWSTVQL